MMVLYNDLYPSLRNTRGDLTVNPPGSLSDLVIDARLLVHRTPKPCARDPYQRPPALVVDDERSPGVAQAGVVLAGLVPGAEHLGVELDHDVLVFMPRDALVVWNYRNQHLV